MHKVRARDLNEQVDKLRDPPVIVKTGRLQNLRILIKLLEQRWSNMCLTVSGKCIPHFPACESVSCLLNLAMSWHEVTIYRWKYSKL